MEKHICPCCGAPLLRVDDHFECEYCGSSFADDYEEKAALTLKAILDEAKLVKLAAQRKVLYDATHAQYPSKDAVIAAASAVLETNPDDVLAKVYLYSHDNDPHRLNLLLTGLYLSKDEADEVIRWMLPSLTLRTIGPIHDFADRNYVYEEKTQVITQIEKEAENVYAGIYETGLPRDVFLCYSSADMPRVIQVMDELERNGLTCFASFRNLRHGLGSAENYLSGIKKAMNSCEVIVFLSSKHSRSIDCDALKVELPYLINELPNKARIEYIIEDYDKDVPYLLKKVLKKAFPEQEHCRGLEDLLDRISNSLKPKEGPKEKEEALKKQAEDARREAEEAKKEAEEAKRKAQEELEKREEEKKLAPVPQPLIGDVPAQFVSAKIGDIVSFGKYDQEGTPSPIAWRVLDREEDYLLVVSDKLLAWLKFDDKKKTKATWRDSSLRAWLNGEFLNTAFSEEEQNLILEAPVATTVNYKYKKDEGEPTIDRVYLLSIDEVTKYFANEQARIAFLTISAKKKSSNFLANAGWYWLRNIGVYEGCAAGVKANGKFDLLGYADDVALSVRPVIRIRLK